MLLILRIAIVLIAALELYWFSDGSALALEMLTPPIEWRPWFNVLFAILVGIVAPLCALAAAGLAIVGKRLGQRWPCRDFALRGARRLYGAVHHCPHRRHDLRVLRRVKFGSLLSQHAECQLAD